MNTFAEHGPMIGPKLFRLTTAWERDDSLTQKQRDAAIQVEA